MTAIPFHLAFPVRDLQVARHFYGQLLKCPEGRSSDTWVDFEFFGHQITAHLGTSAMGGIENPVDGERVPVPHFGAILSWDHYHQLAGHLESQGATFRIKPTIRFKGLVGEQATMFVEDGNGNVLEFKSFKDQAMIFAAT